MTYYSAGYYDYDKYIYTYSYCVKDDSGTNQCSGEYCGDKTWCAFDCCLSLAGGLDMCSDGPGYMSCDGGSGASPSPSPDYVVPDYND